MNNFISSKIDTRNIISNTQIDDTTTRKSQRLYNRANQLSLTVTEQTLTNKGKNILADRLNKLNKDASNLKKVEDGL